MRTAILLLTFLFIGCQSTPKAPAIASATVQSSRGNTEYRRADSSWQPAQAGLDLQPGDELRTDATAELNLDFGRTAGILTLHPNSHLRIDSLSATHPDHAPVTLTLSQGRITGDTFRAPGRPKVQVHTGKGTVKVP
jgi:hypothetical protein